MSKSMKITAGQTITRTLTALIRAMDGQRAVTITYVDSKGDETVRTIEIHNILTTGEGDIVVRVMCRARGERRDLRVDRIKAYTLHRQGFTLPAPTGEAPTSHMARSVERLVSLELNRDYPAPKVKLAA